LTATAPAGRVVFLKDDAAVLEALRQDGRALGLASSLFRASETGAEDARALPVQPDSAGARAVLPADEEVGTARYPLYHYLYVACRAHGGAEANKFVTHLTSARGQRQVERSGFLPARRYPREIILSTNPVGETK
jgi:ABC-type phosphate transport system substrate-binding protein